MRTIHSPEQCQSKDLTLFEGSRNLFFGIGLILAIPLVGLLSIMIMGSHWIRSFALFLIAFPPVLVFIPYRNCFQFDDFGQRIAYFLGRGIPYEKVAGVVFTEILGMISITINISTFKRVVLLHSLPSKDRERLYRAFQNRFDRTKLRWEKPQISKFILITIFCLLVPYLVFIIYIYDKIPVLSTQLEHISMSKAVIGTTNEMINYFPWSFTLPYGASPMNVRNANVQYYKYKEGVIIRLSPGEIKLDSLPRTQRLALKYIAGIEDVYDVLKFACAGRFGMVPLVAKALYIGDKQNVRLYEFSTETAEGISIIGEKDGKREASITVRSKPQGRVLTVQIRSTQKDWNTLVSIVSKYIEETARVSGSR